MKHQNQPRQRAEQRILVFRILTVISLLSTAILCSTFGYLLLSSSEHSFYLSQYNSFIQSAYESISVDVDERISFGKYLAAYYGGYCPDQTHWPNCWIPSQTFLDLTTPYENVLHMVLITLMPIVTINQVSSFENFSQNIYQHENFPSSTGMASGTFGIFSRDPDHPNSFVHDITDEYTQHSPYKLLVPIFQAKKKYYPMLLYNAHSSETQTPMIDEIVSCYQSSPSLCNSSVTDFIDLIESNKYIPTTGVYIAITPAHQPSQLVGFVSYYIRWLDILNEKKFSILANIDLVINTGTTTKTFRFHSNGVKLVGDTSTTGNSARQTFRTVGDETNSESDSSSGDFHDRKFDNLERRFELSLAGSTKKYSLTFYPTEEFWSTYHSNTPFYVCLVSLLIVLTTSMIFMVYDFFVKSESTEQARVLEAKQTYVRFISHVSSLYLSISIYLSHTHSLSGDQNTSEHCLSGNASSSE
jgi:hypothetical protein